VADDGEDAPFSLGFAELDSQNPTRRIISAINLDTWLEALAPRDREIIELRAAGYDLDESAARLGMSRFAVCRRVKELGELLAEHAGMPDAVHRREPKHGKANEEPAPESGIRTKATRGRPKKSVASPAWHKPSRRVRRAA
jgi:hypothetical protein